MTYEEFINFVKSECTYETIYEDSEGRLILVIELLDAYVMVNKAKQGWVGLTEEEVSKLIDQEIGFNSCWGPEEAFAAAIEAKLKEKNA
jgi:hypothetical protein